MGWLERLDELDRRLGLQGSAARPAPVVWVLFAVLVAAMIGVFVASADQNGMLRTIAYVAVLATTYGLMHWAGSRHGRDGLIRAGAVLLVIGFVLTIPAALLGFWQAPLLLLAIGGLPLAALILKRR